jgi:hypothetical protein
LQGGLIPNDFQVVSGMRSSVGSDSTLPILSPPSQQEQILCFMNNPFKKGDKVSIKIKGQVVEAAVNQTWNEEVQVRTTDNKLIWRVVKTVTLVESAPVGQEAASDTATGEVPVKPEVGAPVDATTGDVPADSTTSEGETEQPQAESPQPDNGQSGQGVRYKRTKGHRNRRNKI